jgi:hypothetical protein
MAAQKQKLFEQKKVMTKAECDDKKVLNDDGDKLQWISVCVWMDGWSLIVCEIGFFVAKFAWDVPKRPMPHAQRANARCCALYKKQFRHDHVNDHKRDGVTVSIQFNSIQFISINFQQDLNQYCINTRQTKTCISHPSMCFPSIYILLLFLTPSMSPKSPIIILCVDVLISVFLLRCCGAVGCLPSTVTVA